MLGARASMGLSSGFAAGLPEEEAKRIDDHRPPALLPRGWLWQENRLDEHLGFVQRRELLAR